MIQTSKSAILRLEFLSQFLPELKPDSALYDSALEEANELKFWLGTHQDCRPDTENEFRMPGEVICSMNDQPLSALRSHKVPAENLL